MVEDCEMHSVKIVMVGDVRVGKSALVKQFIANQPPNMYIPTGFDKYPASFQVAGCQYYATIWDTSGSPSYDTVRPLAYQDTDVFVLCFHLGDWYSLHNVLNKWYPEVRKYSKPTTPLVLLGCQNDQRMLDNLYAPFHVTQHALTGHITHIDSPNEVKLRTVYPEEAMDVCRQIGAVTYVETCAYNPETVQGAFELAALASNGRLQAMQSQHQKTISKSSKSSQSSSPHYSLLSQHFSQHLSLSTSPSATLSTLSGSCTSSPGSDSSSSVKLKSSTSSTHLLTRHRSLFKLRKCKSKGELVLGKMNDEKKSCAIM